MDKKMEREIAFEWLSGMASMSLAFQSFLDHMWLHYPEHVKVMASSFIEGDGKEMFEIYLNEFSSPENMANAKADYMRDAEMDR